MLEHAERTVTNEPTGLRVAGAKVGGVGGAPAIIVRERGATPGDRLSHVLRDAVQSRAAGADVPAPAPVLQRFYDPNNVVGHEQAAADYVFGEGTRIAQGYLKGQWDVQFTKHEVHRLVNRTFLHMLPPNLAGQQLAAVKRWSNRLAEDLSRGGNFHKLSLMGADPARRAAVLSAAVQALNVLEQDTETDRVLETDLLKNVLVGTEFTFTNEAIRKTDPGVTDDAAKAMVVRWRELVEKDRLLVATTKSKTGKADKGDERNAVKFTYELDGGRTWWWKLDLDPGCLETQTAPTSKLDLDAVEHIITRHIFGQIEALGLQVDPTAQGGGGHISLDLATLFGTSAELLLTVLSHLQAAASVQQANVVKWGEEFDYVDAPNSPWLADQAFHNDRGKGAALREFTTLVAGLRQQLAAGRIEVGDVAAQLNTFHTLIVNLWATQTKTNPKPTKGTGKQAGALFSTALNAHQQEQKRADNVLASPGHYQAVNVEHLTNADPSRRRIELRAIGAQTSYENLEEHLRYIYARITEARAEVYSALGARRKVFTGS